MLTSVLIYLFPDLCSGKICKNGGNCDIEHGRTVCRCPPRYSGESCEIGKCERKVIILIKNFCILHIYHFLRNMVFFCIAKAMYCHPFIWSVAIYCITITYFQQSRTLVILMWNVLEPIKPVLAIDISYYTKVSSIIKNLKWKAAIQINFLKHHTNPRIRVFTTD